MSPKASSYKADIEYVFPKEGDPDFVRKAQGAYQACIQKGCKFIKDKETLNKVIQDRLADIKDRERTIRNQQILGQRAKNRLVEAVDILSSIEQASCSDKERNKLYRKLRSKIKKISEHLDAIDTTAISTEPNPPSKPTGQDMPRPKPNIGQTVQELNNGPMSQNIASIVEAMTNANAFNNETTKQIQEVLSDLKAQSTDQDDGGQGGKRSKPHLSSKHTTKQDGDITYGGNPCCKGNNLVSISELKTKVERSNKLLITKVQQLSKITEQNIDDNQAILSSLEQVLDESQINANTVYRCSKCGKILISTNPSQDLPLAFNRQCALSLIIKAAFFIYCSIPIERIVNHLLYLDGLRIGTNQIQKSIKDYYFYYLLPIYIGIQVVMSKYANYLHVDETPNPILAHKLKGHLSKKYKENQENKVKAAGYLMAICTAATSVIKAVVYVPIVGRSYDSIAEVLDRFEATTGMTTDNYPVYKTYAKNRQKSGAIFLLQSCLVHFRRAVIAALDLQKLFALGKEPTPEEIEALAKEQANNCSAWRIFLPVLVALQRVFAAERKIKELDLKPAEILEFRLQHSAAPMKLIRTIMTENRDTYIEKRGETWRSRPGVDRGIASAFTQYFNADDQYEAFLKDGNISPDNNPAERAIRPETVTRGQNGGYKTPNGADMAAGLRSVFATLEANKERIYDPEAFLWTDAKKRCLTAAQNAIEKDFSKPMPFYNYEEGNPEGNSYYFASLDMLTELLKLPVAPTLKQIFPDGIDYDWDEVEKETSKRLEAHIKKLREQE